MFSDTEKRKKLERITHSRISDEFITQATGIVTKNPDAIIIAAIPLLIEVNMQDLFNKIIVVHISQEKQIERLMDRDGFSREKCVDVLNAQMPIDDKLYYADYVIHNGKSLEETKIQTLALWKTLKDLQQQKVTG